MKIYSKDFKTPANSLMEILRNFGSCSGKIFVHISRRMVGRDSKKLHYGKRRQPENRQYHKH